MTATSTRLGRRRLGISGRRRPPRDVPPRTALRAGVVVYIARHAADAGLTPARVAARFGVSPRTLSRAFARTALDVPGHIAHARLDLALEALRDARLAHLDDDAVAARCGYRSATGLRCAVVAATGMSPAGYRGLVLDGPRQGSGAPA
ncbi:helix-turn-helix domain-containing protein [Xylanimonas allomyrinae]|uniref:Helix-turn-helix domain-containing protein n=1 Tax=Xylanimonas allomyrinae TaxID=2509459 RepID=A0A4P6EM63_9MICO|nr:helix-turn-helix domain-containing protein [Xylanimonas allomyrinae]QAY63794.1 helix-turn-helix domain-containing protein [Xylanimonas allomyrinae]